MFQAIDAIGPLRDELAAIVNQQGVDGIDDWQRAFENDTGLLDAIYQTNFKAAMGGQLFVEDVELARKGPLKLEDTPQFTFLNLTFGEAVEAFQARGLMTPAQFDALKDDQRATAWTMRKAASEQLAAIAKQRLGEHIANGGTVQTFAQAVNDDEIALGFTPNSHGYLETVFRTSVANSYNAGRLTRQMAPGVRDATGYWRYLTADDDRVRDEHQQLHNKVWKMGDPDALKVYPPNGFNCRCVMVVETPEEVEGETIQTEAPEDATDPGFRAPPVKWT